uniref:CBS domain-containing protein n=1 Tax=Fervidicoccus fontis TaxID=683846 RepID=A0A7J3ZLE1_9CREN
MLRSKKLLEKLKTVKASEIALREFPTVDKDDSVLEAIRLMERFRFDRVIVLENGKPIGLLTKKDLLDKLLVEKTRLSTVARLHVSSFLRKSSLVFAHPGESVGAIARKMVANDISSLPVLEKGELVGLVTKYEIASLYLDVDDIKAKQLSSPIAYIARFGDRIVHLREIIREKKAFFFPVIGLEGKLVGVVGIDEIANAFVSFHEYVPERLRKVGKYQLFVEDVLRRPPPVVRENDPASAVARIIVEERFRGVIVLGDDEQLSGAVTIDDLTEAVFQTHSLNLEGNAN